MARRCPGRVGPANAPLGRALDRTIERCREVRLRTYPDGMIQPGDLAIVETALPDIGPNDLVVRNRWFRISISTRLMANPDAQAVEGIPFPALKPGDTLADGAIGQVVTSPPGSGFAVGAYVSHPWGGGTTRSSMPDGASRSARPRSSRRPISAMAGRPTRP